MVPLFHATAPDFEPAPCVIGRSLGPSPGGAVHSAGFERYFQGVHASGKLDRLEFSRASQVFARAERGRKRIPRASAGKPIMITAHEAAIADSLPRRLARMRLYVGQMFPMPLMLFSAASHFLALWFTLQALAGIAPVRATW